MDFEFELEFPTAVVIVNKMSLSEAGTTTEHPLSRPQEWKLRGKEDRHVCVLLQCQR